MFMLPPNRCMVRGRVLVPDRAQPWYTRRRDWVTGTEGPISRCVTGVNSRVDRAKGVSRDKID